MYYICCSVAYNKVYKHDLFTSNAIGYLNTSLQNAHISLLMQRYNSFSLEEK